MNMQLFPDVDEKQARILAAALTVFATYGFRRTSMEDVAREAGMSRAALYQHFRNKEDILVHGVTAFFAATEAAMKEGLTPGRPLAEAVQYGCEATAGDMARLLMNSPHGSEILTMKSSLPADVIADGNARIARVWSDWLAEEARAGRLRLPEGGAMATAQAIMAGQHGQKEIARDYDDYRARLTVFADLMARALRP